MAMRRKLRPFHSLLVLVAAQALALWGCATTSAVKARKAQDENTAAYQYDLASVSYNYGLEDEAVRYLEQALALDPDHHPSLFLLSTLRLKRGEYPAAEAGFLKCLALKPEDAEAHTRLGMVYRQTGAQEKAEGEFLKAWSLEPSTTAALNLAQHFFDLDRLDKALEYT
ncbi:MAG: tetratricopeptide repeat protein, partial [Candidatus Aminicenantes bacterium]|nr:tetratricopeptide repeat protein [Candidatus Aminicenantes bacterium]